MPRSRHLAAALAAACLWTCAAPPKPPPGHPGRPAAAAKRVTELADAYVDAYLKQFPENGTQALLPGFRHDRLTDNSLAAVRAWQTTEDGIAARLSEVRADGLWGRPEWVTYESGFASRDEALAYSRTIVEKARLALPGRFGLLPKASVAVEPLQAFQEKSGYSQYIGASEDGSRPGVYRINLGRDEGRSRAQAEITAFHEAYPGHHLQISIAQERAHSHPIARLISNAGFAEGWGRYSETLADEMGLYSSDLSRLALAAELPTGMVVDPGVHAVGWTRRQAIDFFRAKQIGASEESAGSYVDRISVLPGQMATYGVGEREIFELREQAKRELGARFDIHEFHDRVLEDGSITLGMLRQKIERWIAERRQG